MEAADLYQSLLEPHKIQADKLPIRSFEYYLFELSYLPLQLHCQIADRLQRISNNGALAISVDDFVNIFVFNTA